MEAENHTQAFKRMYDALNDPEMAAKAKRETEREKRKGEKISDTGL